jgi:hypothetical protein
MEGELRVRGSLRLGKIFGIPIGVNYTWFIVFALVTLSLATGYFPSRYGDWPGTWALAC